MLKISHALRTARWWQGCDIPIQPHLIAKALATFACHEKTVAWPSQGRPGQWRELLEGSALSPFLFSHSARLLATKGSHFPNSAPGFYLYSNHLH